MDQQNSYISRIVLVLTPFFIIASGALVNWAQTAMNVNLDKDQVTALLIGTFISVAGVIWKWLHGRQLFEKGVADKQTEAIKLAQQGLPAGLEQHTPITGVPSDDIHPGELDPDNVPHPDGIVDELDLQGEPKEVANSDHEAAGE